VTDPFLCHYKRLEPRVGREDLMRIAHTGLYRVASLLSAHAHAVRKMPSTCPSRTTENHSCLSTLLSVLLSAMGRSEF